MSKRTLLTLGVLVVLFFVLLGTLHFEDGADIGPWSRHQYTDGNTYKTYVQELRAVHMALLAHDALFERYGAMKSIRRLAKTCVPGLYECMEDLPHLLAWLLRDMLADRNVSPALFAAFERVQVRVGLLYASCSVRLPATSTSSCTVALRYAFVSPFVNRAPSGGLKTMD